MYKPIVVPVDNGIVHSSKTEWAVDTVKHMDELKIIIQNEARQKKSI